MILGLGRYSRIGTQTVVGGSLKPLKSQLRHMLGRRREFLEKRGFLEKREFLKMLGFSEVLRFSRKLMCLEGHESPTMLKSAPMRRSTAQPTSTVRHVSTEKCRYAVTLTSS